MPTAHVVPFAPPARITSWRWGRSRSPRCAAARSPPRRRSRRSSPSRRRTVGAPGNPSVGIVPFTDAIYRSCAEAPPPKKARLHGSRRRRLPLRDRPARGDRRAVRRLPQHGRPARDATGTSLYSTTESGDRLAALRPDQLLRRAQARPPLLARRARMGRQALRLRQLPALRPLRQLALQRQGARASKRAAKTASATSPTASASRATPRRGMYDMRNPKTTRTGKTGFVIPSQNEWIKAAYYDPNGGGTYSYWKYPTNPGDFGDGNGRRRRPGDRSTPTTGNVTNAATQPLAIFHSRRRRRRRPGARPASQRRSLRHRQPLRPRRRNATKRPSRAASARSARPSPPRPGARSTRAATRSSGPTRSPPPPFGVKGHRVWRRLHGGIANAPVYQLWLSAVGLQPQDNAFFTATYPWLGFRIGVIGNPKPS